MSSPPAARIILVAACAASLALGISLRAKLRDEDAAKDAAASPVATGRDLLGKADSWKAGLPSNKKGALRRAIAKCDDQSLWECAAEPSDELETFEAVRHELIDRLGWGAWQHVLDMEPGPNRNMLARWFLDDFSERDPWKAYEVWQAAAGKFERDGWEDSAFYSFSQAATAISAGKLVEVMRSMRRDTDHFRHEVEVKFPAGFEFREVMDYLVSGEERPALVPEKLMVEWAHRSPQDAVEWLSANPGFEVSKEERREIYANVAASDLDATRMAQVLGQLAATMPDLVEEAWTEIGGDSRGVVNPSILHTASLLGRRESYLSSVLFSGISHDAVDPSWQELPLGERMSIMGKVEVEWALKRPSPLDERARERWRRLLAETWKQ